VTLLASVSVRASPCRGSNVTVAAWLSGLVMVLLVSQIKQVTATSVGSPTPVEGTADSIEIVLIVPWRS